jgi:hypothetical protein
MTTSEELDEIFQVTISPCEARLILSHSWQDPHPVRASTTKHRIAIMDKEGVKEVIVAG